MMIRLGPLPPAPPGPPLGAPDRRGAAGVRAAPRGFAGARVRLEAGAVRRGADPVHRGGRGREPRYRQDPHHHQERGGAARRLPGPPAGGSLVRVRRVDRGRQPHEQLPRPVQQDHPDLLLRGPRPETEGQTAELVKFGVFLPVSGRAAGPVLMEAARGAEALGYDSVWAADRIIIPWEIKTVYPYSAEGRFIVPPDRPFLEPLTCLAFLAGCTEKIQLGMSVLVMPYRHPLYWAKIATTIDHLSKGRLILGVGVGWMGGGGARAQRGAASCGAVWSPFFVRIPPRELAARSDNVRRWAREAGRD